MEGFTHLIPYAAGHEVIRQQRRRLTLIKMTPDLLYDQLIGMAAPRSWCSPGRQPGVGSLHRLRDAVENGWPHPLAIESTPTPPWPMPTRRARRDCRARSFVATSGRPAEGQSRIKHITCPFSREQLAAVPAHRPDVAIVHALRADRRQLLLEGIVGVRRRWCSRPSARSYGRGDRGGLRAAQLQRRDPAGWTVGAIVKVPGRRIPFLRAGLLQGAITPSTCLGQDRARARDVLA